MQYIRKYLNFIRAPPLGFADSEANNKSQHSRILPTISSTGKLEYTKYTAADISYRDTIIKSLILPAVFEGHLPPLYNKFIKLFNVKYVAINCPHNSHIASNPTYVHNSLITFIDYPRNITERLNLNLLDFYQLDQITPELQSIIDVFRLKYVTIGKYKIHTSCIDEFYNEISQHEKDNRHQLPLPSTLALKFEDIPAVIPDFYHPSWFSPEYQTLLSLLGIQYIGVQFPDSRTYMVNRDEIKKVGKRFGMF